MESSRLPLLEFVIRDMSSLLVDARRMQGAVRQKKSREKVSSVTGDVMLSLFSDSKSFVWNTKLLPEVR